MCQNYQTLFDSTLRMDDVALDKLTLLKLKMLRAKYEKIRLVAIPISPTKDQQHDPLVTAITTNNVLLQNLLLNQQGTIKSPVIGKYIIPQIKSTRSNSGRRLLKRFRKAALAIFFVVALLKSRKKRSRSYRQSKLVARPQSKIITRNVDLSGEMNLIEFFVQSANLKQWMSKLVLATAQGADFFGGVSGPIMKRASNFDVLRLSALLKDLVGEITSINPTEVQVACIEGFVYVKEFLQLGVMFPSGYLLDYEIEAMRKLYTEGNTPVVSAAFTLILSTIFVRIIIKRILLNPIHSKLLSKKDITDYLMRNIKIIVLVLYRMLFDVSNSQIRDESFFTEISRLPPEDDEDLFISEELQSNLFRRIEDTTKECAMELVEFAKSFYDKSVLP